MEAKTWKTPDGKLVMRVEASPGGNQLHTVNGQFVGEAAWNAIIAALGDRLAPVPPPDPDVEAAAKAVADWVRFGQGSLPVLEDVVTRERHAARESGRAEGKAEAVSYLDSPIAAAQHSGRVAEIRCAAHILRAWAECE